MGIEGRPKKGFADEFEQQLMRARQKAGKKIGSQAVKDRKDALIARNKERLGGGVRTASTRSERWRSVSKGGKISPYRKKAVRYSTANKDRMLVLLDLYPNAMTHEDGATLRPTSGKYLFLQDKRRRAQPGDKTFITKSGAVMAVKPWKKQKPGQPKPKQSKPRLIGVLKRSVTIQSMKTEWRLDNIAERYLEDYRDAIEQALIDQL